MSGHVEVMILHIGEENEEARKRLELEAIKFFPRCLNVKILKEEPSELLK